MTRDISSHWLGNQNDHIVDEALGGSSNHPSTSCDHLCDRSAYYPSNVIPLYPRKAKGRSLGSARLQNDDDHNFCNTANWDFVFGSGDAYDSEFLRWSHKSTLEYIVWCKNCLFLGATWRTIQMTGAMSIDGVC